MKVRVQQVTVRGTKAVSAPGDAEAIIVPEGVTELAGGCFCGMTCLRSVTLPKTLKVIGPHSFSGCIRLEKAVIPDGVVEIGARAFDTGRPLQLEMSVNCPHWEPWEEISLLHISGSSVSFRDDHGEIAARVTLSCDNESRSKQISAGLAISSAGGKFDFARYDKFIFMLKRAPNKIRAALARIEYPYELPAETREKYCDYLLRQSMNAGTMLIGEDRTETLSMLCEKRLIRPDAARKLIDFAGSQGKVEAAAMLLDYYNRYCSGTFDPTGALSLN